MEFSGVVGFIIIITNSESFKWVQLLSVVVPSVLKNLLKKGMNPDYINIWFNLHQNTADDTKRAYGFDDCYLLSLV